MIRTFNLTLFTFLSLFISAQSDVFESDFCEGWPNGFDTELCLGMTTFNIDVSGVGVLGEDNYGLLEVYIFLYTGGSFEAELYLRAPNGDEFHLAGESLGSLPNFSGFDVEFGATFRSCCSLLSHDDPSAGPSGPDGTYQPYEDFSVLNNGEINANGDWEIGICGTFFPAEFFCAELRFGNLNPEPVVFIAGTSCQTSNNGSISVLEVQGEGCDGDDEFFFSLNGGAITSETTYDGLVAGETYILGMYEELPGGSCSPDENLIEEYVFEIYAEDLSFPEIIDCPEGVELYLDDECKVSYTVTAPDFMDNCVISSATVSITPPNGIQSEPIAFNPNQQFPLELNGDGEYSFLWEVIDDNNNETTCLSEFVITDNQPPIWLEQHVEVFGECEIDDFNDLIDQGLDILMTFENCSFVDFIDIDLSDDSGCGESMIYTFTYEIVDSEENVNPETGTVTIYFEDTTAPQLIGIPDDVTINCLDDFPSLPNVTAEDECEGDLTNSITMSSETTVVTCETGEMAESIVYTWTVTDGCGNQAEESWGISIDMASSSNDISLLEEEVVFPKVTAHMINLNLRNITNCQILIQDADGQLIYTYDTKQQKIFQNKIDVESYESGMYFLSIITTDGVHTEQFIKI